MSALKYWHDDPSLQSGGEWRYVTIPLVGQPVRVERFSNFGGNTDITTTTPTQFGESIVIPNPGMAVSVWGSFTGYIYQTNSAQTGSAAVRVEISFDGGSTWENGNAEYGTSHGGFCPISAQFTREGVPTGDVHIRVMVMDYTGVQMRVAGSSELVAKMYGGHVILDNRYQIANDTGWINATLENGWTNYNTASFAPARYRKKNGVVYVQGFMNPTTSTNIIAFTLPEGLRPDIDLYLPILPSDAASASNAHIRFASNGVVRLANYGSGSGWISFAHSFPVD